MYHRLFNRQGLHVPAFPKPRCHKTIIHNSPNPNMNAGYAAPGDPGAGHGAGELPAPQPPLAAAAGLPALLQEHAPPAVRALLRGRPRHRRPAAGGAVAEYRPMAPTAYQAGRYIICSATMHDTMPLLLLSRGLLTPYRLLKQFMEHPRNGMCSPLQLRL